MTKALLPAKKSKTAQAATGSPCRMPRLTRTTEPGWSLSGLCRPQQPLETELK